MTFPVAPPEHESTSALRRLSSVPTSMYVEGMDPDESHKLLRQLSAHILDSRAYHHRWSTDEMILWDNWRMLHSVTPVPLDEERVMQRTTIKGDYGVGRRLAFPEAAE